MVDTDLLSSKLSIDVQHPLHPSHSRPNFPLKQVDALSTVQSLEESFPKIAKQERPTIEGIGHRRRLDDSQKDTVFGPTRIFEADKIAGETPVARSGKRLIHTIEQSKPTQNPARRHGLQLKFGYFGGRPEAHAVHTDTNSDVPAGWLLGCDDTRHTKPEDYALLDPKATRGSVTKRSGNYPSDPFDSGFSESSKELPGRRYLSTSHADFNDTKEAFLGMGHKLADGQRISTQQKRFQTVDTFPPAHRLDSSPANPMSNPPVGSAEGELFANEELFQPPRRLMRKVVGSEVYNNFDKHFLKGPDKIENPLASPLSLEETDLDNPTVPDLSQYTARSWEWASSPEASQDAIGK